MADSGGAFWLYPDWSGGDNLRDPGTRPFWELPPHYDDEQPQPAHHECGPFVTLWTGYRYCKICEREVK